MDLQKIHLHCLSFPGVEETYPFGETPVCYKLHGKIFAMMFHAWEQPLIALKCRRDMSFFYRGIYPDQVVRAYHFSDMHQPYWFSVKMENFPEDELLRMIGEAYDALRESVIPRNKQKKSDTL